MLEWQTSLAEPFRARNSASNTSSSATSNQQDTTVCKFISHLKKRKNKQSVLTKSLLIVIFLDVEDLRVADDGTVIVFFTDKTRFEYNTGARLWREINPDIELDGQKGKSGDNHFAVATTSGQKITSAGLQLNSEEQSMLQGTKKDINLVSLVDLIGKLDTSAKHQIQKLTTDDNAANSEIVNQEQVDSNALIRSKLTVMQESVEVYERLGLKTEYLYSYRMLVFLILQAGDFNGLARELTKFVGDAGLNIEGLSGTDRYRTVLTRLWNGQSPNNTEKEKGIIIRTGDG